MDRLDSWLNHLHGWRFALLSWVELSLCVMPIVLGLWDFYGPTSHDPDAVVLTVAACSVLVAAPIAVIGAVVHGSRRSASTKPISWRAHAGLLLVGISLTVDAIAEQVIGTHRHRRIVGLVSALLGLVGAVLLLSTLRESGQRRSA